MTKKCVQCGKNFTLSDSEIDFYNSKNLSLPKRCKQCRKKNKALKNSHTNKKTPVEYKSYYISKPISIETFLTIVISFILMLGVCFIDLVPLLKVVLFTAFSAFFIWSFFSTFRNKILIQEFDTSPYKYTFYDTNSMVSHYVKHKAQTECNSMEEYLFKANFVIIDKGNLQKRSRDDDLIFYNRKTNEFAVVAKAGYIRTYFTASEKYYLKQ